ncbi:pyrimidodiazepine synthase-like [Drosophila sulfurigaster albostrigata]|uniref:pyrimidodiazepine synthase-like n=1 Tax=Drosophila sulfurigaster albostrigata TaxID=89887 RepID=UPI002D21DA2B|nr:pyrimidodiazepine synthase-like [Drosophila sulfurigaster albostrigata]
MSAENPLTKGSTHPALPDDGAPRLYSNRYCPYAQRAHLTLNAKKVPHHVVYIDLVNKPEWLVDVSPLLKVPALHLVGGNSKPSLIESLIIVEYLDEKYPQNPLLPKDPLKRAQDKILVERFNAASGALMKIALQGGDGSDLWPVFDIFEEELAKRSTPYFGGEKPGFLDYMIWPWFERLPVAEYFLKERFNFNKERYAKLSAWVDLIVKDEVVQSHYATPEAHVSHFKKVAELFKNRK